MRKQKHLASFAYGAFGLSLLTASGAGQAAPPITVTVNGGAVAFTGTPPTQVQGAVLVPLRGVFQALGASVNYNNVTRTITAQKGTANVVLPLGSLTATVNGQTQTLTQPAQSVGGTTLVPLRFVAQALGASVQWHADSSTVEIKTSEPHLATLPPAPGQGVVTGLLTHVYSDTNPTQITVRVNGENTAVPVAPSTIILRSTTGQAGMQVTLNELKAGDQVTVQRDGQGNALSVTAVFGELRGTVKSIGKLAGGGNVITLNDGTTVPLAPGAPITMDSRPIALGDVMAGERVVIRTDAANSMGYGVALATGSEPNPTPPGTRPANTAGGPSVTSFSVTAAGPLKEGDALRATLTGTPGGRASFTLPGVAENVALSETSPGVYTGAYTVKSKDEATGASVLGKLTVNGQDAPLIQASDKVMIDSQPPKIAELNPARGATVETERPLIYATLSDGGGTGVNTASVKIELDSKDVTGQATITPAFFSLKPETPLRSGEHQIAVTAADKAGNTQTTNWTFRVTPSKLVQTFESSAVAGQTLGVGTPLTFTLHAQPGGQASFSLGTVVKDAPLTEASPGVYTGAYTVAPGDTFDNAPVTARFVAKDGKEVTTSLQTKLTLVAGLPAAPRITEPAAGAKVSDALTIKGTATPHATVRVTLDYTNHPLGGLFALNGSAGSKEVTADVLGNWSADGFSLNSNSLFGGGRTDLTISAVTVSANGDESPAATVKATRG